MQTLSTLRVGPERLDVAEELLDKGGHMWDVPKALGDPNERHARFVQRELDHVKPLNQFVERLRREVGADRKIPYFDPWDGGTGARALFLLEAPGAKAIASGFVSRNNPDETAKNMWQLQRDAGLPRTETVLWNIVPWYVGNGTRIRAVTTAEIAEARPFLSELLSLLPGLQIVALVGRKAERAKPLLERTGLRVVSTWHTSPLVFASRPERRAEILMTFQSIALELDIT